MKVKDFLLLGGIIAIICLLMFNEPEKSVYSGPSIDYINTIEKTIKGKTDTITIYKTQVIEKLKIVKEIHKSVDTLRILVSEAVKENDTVKIIKSQSMLIDTLIIENTYLYEVVSLKDSVIFKQDERDSLRIVEIDVLKNDNKKTKRKLNGSIGLNVVQLIALIFKK